MTTSVQSPKSYVSKEPKIGNGDKCDSTVITKQCSYDQTSNNHVVDTPNTATHDKTQTINLTEEKLQTQKAPIVERSTIILNQLPQEAQRSDIHSSKRHPVNNLTESDKSEVNVVMATAFIHEAHNKIETINVPVVANLPDQSSPQTRRRPEILSRSNSKETTPKKQLKTDNTQISGSLNESTLPVVSKSNTEFTRERKGNTNGILNPVPVEKQSPKSKSAPDNEMFSDGEDSETPVISQQLLDHLDEIDLTPPEKCTPTPPYSKEREESTEQDEPLIPTYIHKIKSAKLKSQTKVSSAIITNGKATPELASKQPFNCQDTEKQDTLAKIEKRKTLPKTLEDIPHKRLDQQMDNNAQKSPSAAKNIKDQHNGPVKKTAGEITSENNNSLAQVENNVTNKQTLKNSKPKVSKVMSVSEVSIGGDNKSINPSDDHLTLSKVVTSTDTMDARTGSKQADTFVITTQPVTDRKTTEVGPPIGKIVSTAATETMAYHQQKGAFGKRTLQCSSGTSLTLTEQSTKEVSSAKASFAIIQTKYDPPTTVVSPEKKGSPSDIANNMDLGQRKDTDCKAQSNLSSNLKGIMADQLTEVSQSDTIGSNKAVDLRVQSLAATTPG